MKLKTYYFRVIYFIALGCGLFGCTEPFKLETKVFENALVVEATITNEFKQQVVKLSRTYPLENEIPTIETGAVVKIIDGNNINHEFYEAQPGVYLSNQEFKAVEGISYRLEISTSDGNEYESNPEYLPQNVEIEKIYPELIEKNGENGIQVLLDGTKGTADTDYFRYEYEETYKIEVPSYSIYDIRLYNISNDLTYSYDFVNKEEDVSICYSTKTSTKIILTSSNGLTENKINRFPIRFIPVNNSVIRERYSIVVRQYTQSAEAYNFYKVINDLGLGGSLLIDNQPGFVQGNLVSVNNENEKVVGYFELSSVDVSDRIYFNYEDFNIAKPPYFFECDDIVVGTTDPRDKATLYDLYFAGYKYFGKSEEGLILVKPQCGDCTTFSSKEKPQFWED